MLLQQVDEIMDRDNTSSSLPQISTADTQRELKIRHVERQQFETVLVMQGGGSLGAYECGVYKALSGHGIKFDIVAGTSIGAVNAAIIAGSRNDHPAKDLEEFWLEVAETATSAIVPDSVRAFVSSTFGALYGNPNVFFPVWFGSSGLLTNHFLLYSKVGWWPPHLYELANLKKTLERYIDFSKLNSKNVPRAILTCTDIKKSEAVIFDSMTTKIDADHVTACAGYPFYGIAWTEKDGRFLWDGALLSNTPLREVIDSSPKHDKKVYIVNLFPHLQEELPKNLLEIWHRARDIMHTDKTDNSVRMSKVISGYLLLMKEMHDILSNTELSPELHDRFRKIEPVYHRLADARGAIIDEITRIERSEDAPFLFEDADFSLATIKKLINQGEADAERAINRNKSRVEYS
jgi:NTE family protein